jgi:nucleoside-diphosphate-sugar epimerase
MIAIDSLSWNSFWHYFMNRQSFLVAGGAGFLGSHLADAPLEAGHTVTTQDDLSVGKMQNVAHHLNHPNFHLKTLGFQATTSPEEGLHQTIEWFKEHRDA